MDQLIKTFEYVRLHRYNRHADSNVWVDPLGWSDMGGKKFFEFTCGWHRRGATYIADNY